MRVRLWCRDCLVPLDLDVEAGERSRACVGCKKTVVLDLPAGEGTRAPLAKCPACTCTGLYLESDFPRLLGWGILIGTISLFVYATIHWPKWSTFVLLGVAALDYFVYRSLPLRTVCYRCCAEFRGFPKNDALRGYDLETAQRYPEYEEFLKQRRARRS